MGLYQKPLCTFGAWSSLSHGLWILAKYIFKGVVGIFLNDPWSYFCLISFTFPLCLSLIFSSTEDKSSFSSLLSGRWGTWLAEDKNSPKKSRHSWARTAAREFAQGRARQGPSPFLLQGAADHRPRATRVKYSPLQPCPGTQQGF